MGLGLCTRCVDLCAVHSGDLSDEAELHFRGHGHGQTLGVQKVGCEALRFQPNLVLSAWKAKDSRLYGGAVPVRDGRDFSFQLRRSLSAMNTEWAWVPGTLGVLLYVTIEMKTLPHHSLYTRGSVGQVARQLLFRLSFKIKHSFIRNG